MPGQQHDLHSNASVEGTLCWAWGVCREAWQDYGQPPEQARVHFSKVLTESAQGWQGLLYYSDIQPLTDEGWCPKAVAMVSPARVVGNRAFCIGERGTGSCYGACFPTLDQCFGLCETHPNTL